MSHQSSCPKLLGDEHIDALASYACMPWPPVSLTAARAAATWQKPLGDHPQVLGKPDLGHPQLVIVFHGERIQARGLGNLTEGCPLASPPARQVHVKAVHLQL